MIALVGACRKKSSDGSRHSERVTVNFIFLDKGSFWAPPLTYFYLPKGPGHTFFPYLSRFINYFCSGPISGDPMRPQPKHAPTSARTDE